MLIPSIDLMGGRVVQLVQGEDLALGFDDLEYWIDRFADYPLVQLIDLDAAKRQGDNRRLIESIVRRLPCQVGGGIRSSAEAKILLDMGAQRVIFGSSLFNGQAASEPSIAKVPPPSPTLCARNLPKSLLFPSVWSNWFSASTPKTAKSPYAAGGKRLNYGPRTRCSSWNRFAARSSIPTWIRKVPCQDFR